MKNLSVSARKSENYTLIISIQGDGQDIVKQYNKCCKTDWSPTYEERIQQGMLLYKAVFHDEVETQFYELLRSAKNSRTKMRLMFEIKEPTVNTMDWGLLYDPHNYRFLIEDDCIEIYHRRDDIPRIGVTSLSAPLKVAFIHLGLSAKEAEHLELWVNNELSSLVETGSLKLSSHTGIKLSAGDLNALRDIEIFHLVIKSSDRKLLSQAKKSHGAARIGKKDVKENPWDNLRAALGVNSRGMLSFINKKPVVPDDRIIDCLQSKGWPLFCRSDIFYFDRQESQCLRDIYFAIVSYDVNHLNLNWVLQRQLAMDLRNTPRLRKYQLFTFGDTFFQDQAKIDRTQETNLKKYLRSAIYSVERFYQWEKLYAELMFSTRLRLQKLDLKDVEDVCELEERIYKLEEALQEFDKLIIIGEPGTGKTTACQRATWQLSKLAFQQLNANQPNIKPQIPLYIPLKSLSASITSENLTLFEHIANALFEQLPELEAQRTALKEFLKSYNLILLLDGLNEVSPFSLRNRLIAEILKIREDYVSGTSAIRIVVTSRKHNLDIARFISEGEFKVLEIVELSPSDIRTFAECYLPSDKSTDTFLECLNPKLLTAARNPLMLRLLLSDFMEGKTLIGSRAQLLHNFCHRCLYNPCDVLEHTIPQQVRLKELVLTNVAYQCWKRDASLSISLVEACGYAMECGLDKETAEKLFDELAQNGILYKNIDDHGHEHLEFRYQSYHEYYCAMKVAEIWRKAKTNKFKRLCQQEEWHEIIALSAGVIEMENNDSSDNIQKRPEINLINYLKGRRQMILAGMCIWNMESMNKQLKDFETWIINRANSACTILTKISIFTLFYFIMPVWVTTLFLTMTYTNNHDFYIWSYGRFTLGTSTIACIVIYTVVPFMLYGFYKKISSWIAFRLERHILRPSLVALNYIGSGYARASIVDLYNAYDLASAKADMDDDLQRIDPTIDAQRQAIKGIKDFMPREGYKPEDLLTLIDYEDFPIEDIIMIAKIVAKEVTPLQLREFALRVRHKNNSIALKTLRAAAVITKYNLELREEWEVFTKTKLPAHLATLPSERRGQARFLSGIWDLLISCSLEAKIFVCVTLTILGVIFYGIKAKDMVLVLSSIAGLAANYIVAFLMARNKNTHIDK